MNSKSNEPIVTSKYVHIPKLRDKLEWLYARHNSIKTQNELADALDVSGSTLSGWLTGTRRKAGSREDKAILISGFFNPDSIPTKHYRRFIELWGLPESLLHLEDIPSFRAALSIYDGAPSPWDDLILSLPDDEAIEIVTHATRGISNPDIDDDPNLPNLRTGEEILVRVANPGLRHAMLLLHDRSGWSCLHPNAKYPETGVDGSVVFPRQTKQSSPKYAKIQDPTGLHRILTILTQQPLPAAVLSALLRPPIDQRELDQVAGVVRRLLANGPEACRLMSRRFLVSS